LATAAIAACGGGSTPTPIVVDPPFSGTQSAVVTNAAGPLVLPSAEGFGGTLLLGGALATQPTLTETLTNVRPSGAPVLQATARSTAGRSTASVLPGSQVVYVALTSNLSFTEPSAPTLALALPLHDFSVGTSYYLAFYDSAQPQFGWQNGFAGPGTINGTTITFTANVAAAFTWAANVPYVFGVYTNTGAAPTPAATPAPNASPAPTASPASTASPTPTAAVVVTSSATQTYVGTPQTFTASQAAFGGALSASVSCTNGANSTGTVGTVSPASATPASAGGTAQFTFTPQNPGTCTVSVLGTGGASGTIFFSVSATSLGVQ
jgi:hypothetical protein